MELLTVLSQSYGLSVADIGLIEAGRINRNYKITSNAGKEYCLKVYSDAVPDSRLLDGLKVTTYLAPLAFPVPRVVLTINDKEVLYTPEGRYLLLQYIPGRNLLKEEVGVAECFGMGAMLGRLHHSLRFFPTADRLYDSLWRGSASSLPRVFDLLSHIQSKKSHDDFDRFAIASLTYRIQVMHELEVGPEQFSHLQRQALHGDYHLGNVIFNSSGDVSGVLDFDQTCFSFPAWELMRAIAFTCFDGNKFSFDRAAAILKGYSVNGGTLTPADYLEMPRLWYCQMVRGLWGLREHYQGEADPRQDEAAYGRHATMVWLGNNLKGMRDFVWNTIKT